MEKIDKEFDKPIELEELKSIDKEDDEYVILKFHKLGDNKKASRERNEKLHTTLNKDKLTTLLESGINTGDLKLEFLKEASDGDLLDICGMQTICKAVDETIEMLEAIGKIRDLFKNVKEDLS